MCGRYSFVASPEQLRQQFGELEIGHSLKLSYNLAPTQHAYIITDEQPGKLEYCTWGLVPHWAKDRSSAAKLINARAEGIVAKPSFRVPIRKRRCLVPADSFYEWRLEGKDKKPYRIMAADGKLLAMAGIWDTWYDGEYAVKTFSIITVPPNKEMALLHNRMPMLLHTTALQRDWLSDLSVDAVTDMLKTPPDGLLHKYPVSSKINDVRNDSPELHEKIGEQGRLF